MSAFVIVFAGGRYLAHSRDRTGPPGREYDGWEPFRWVADLTDAEKFGSHAAAVLFARGAVKHDQFEIRELPVAPGPGREMIA